MKAENEELNDWKREYFKPGGGDALLFYVIFGVLDQKISCSRSKYRYGGKPAGIQIEWCGPNSNPDVLSSFLEGYLWEQLQLTDPKLAKIIAQQKTCIILRGSFPDPADLNYFRDAVALVTCLLDQGGVAVYDPQMFQWWSPSRWKEHIFEPAGPVPRHHTVILISENPDGSKWIHTRGMRKFGRPDLSIPNVADAQKDALINLCNRFIELQAFGGIIPEGQEIRMRSLPDGLRCFHGGSLDDPDFNNVHVTISSSSRATPAS